MSHCMTTNQSLRVVTLCCVLQVIEGVPSLPPVASAAVLHGACLSAEGVKLVKVQRQTRLRDMTCKAGSVAYGCVFDIAALRRDMKLCVCVCSCPCLQVGVVSQRRAWANPEALTGDVLALYERPLRVEGWDAALRATCRQAAATQPQQLAAHFAAIKQQPVLCVTGELQHHLRVKATRCCVASYSMTCRWDGPHRLCCCMQCKSDMLSIQADVCWHSCMLWSTLACTACN